MNDKNNSVIRGCLSTYFQGWSLKPHKEQIRLAKNYYNENGDIPEFMYAPAPTDAPNRFRFAVTEGGILITVNTYKTDIIMLPYRNQHVQQSVPLSRRQKDALKQAFHKHVLSLL